MKRLLAVVVMFWAAPMFAAGPGCAPVVTPLFRVETAEVQLTFAVVGDHNQVVTDLSPRDFNVLRDGMPVDGITTFESAQDVPLSLILLSDVSESMRKMRSVEQAAKVYLSQLRFTNSDSISFLDFGTHLQNTKSPGTADTHLTSLYDSAIEVVRKLDSGKGRRAIVLLSDGEDNYSMNGLDDLVNEAQRNDVTFYTLDTAPWDAMGANSLRTLAEKTGGHYFPIRKDVEAITAFQEIEGELRHRFMVTFHADSRKGMHRLAIQSTGRNLKFLHRAMYYQPKQGGKRAETVDLPTVASR